MRIVSLVALAALGALSAAACGGGAQLRVKGAAFSLSSKEAGLASEYEREEPHAGSVVTRCDYWTKRNEDASGNHLIGLFSWPPEYFENLRSWTAAKEAEVCDVARAEADVRAAKLNDDARQQALVDAKREHEARDERMWTQARAAECAAGTREDACDGVRAYLSLLPSGDRAGDAKAALEAGTPKLAELRRVREEDAARREAEGAKLEEAAGFRVSSLRVTPEDVPAGAGARGQYLKIAFDLTASRAIARGVTPIVRAACQVAGKRMVDVDVGLDPHLYELAAGDTKQIDASPYLKHPLQAAPAQCEIVVMKGSAVDTTGTLVRSFCYAPGQAVKDGACGL